MTFLPQTQHSDTLAEQPPIATQATPKPTIVEQPPIATHNPRQTQKITNP